MASATQIVANPLVKLLYIGHSGTGKTGSLISLLRAGYHIRLTNPRG